MDVGELYSEYTPWGYSGAYYYVRVGYGWGQLRPGATQADGRVPHAKQTFSSGVQPSSLSMSSAGPQGGTRCEGWRRTDAGWQVRDNRDRR